MLTIDCATSADSGQLCGLLRAVPLPGSISLRYSREPDYFAACRFEGEENQVAVCRTNGVITTSAVRSIRTLYINGREQKLGYLHGLRTSVPHRHRGHFGRGFLYVKQLHDADKAVPAYLATVIDDDRETQRMFGKARRHFPGFHDLGRFIISAIPLSTAKRIVRNPSIERASCFTRERLISGINANGNRRQFFPVCSDRGLTDCVACGFSPDNIYVRARDGTLRGTLGVWDQSAVKQIYVRSYRGLMWRFRPAINVVLKTAGYPRLPSPEGEVKVLYACFVTAADDDPSIVRDLLLHALETWSGRGFDFLLIGFHERDPLRRSLRGLPRISYASRLYLAAWEDCAGYRHLLDESRVPYLETGTL